MSLPPKGTGGLEIAHIAIATSSLKESLAKIEAILAIKPQGPIEEVSDQKVKTQFVSIGGVRLEFLEPTATDSPISKFIEKRGGGIHHIAVYVPDLTNQLKELKQKGIPLIDDTPRRGAEGCKVAFVHPKAIGGVLLELIERPH